MLSVFSSLLNIIIIKDSEDARGWQRNVMPPIIKGWKRCPYLSGENNNPHLQLSVSVLVCVCSVLCVAAKCGGKRMIKENSIDMECQ